MCERQVRLSLLSHHQGSPGPQDQGRTVDHRLHFSMIVIMVIVVTACNEEAAQHQHRWFSVLPARKVWSHKTQTNILSSFFIISALSLMIFSNSIR